MKVDPLYAAALQDRARLSQELAAVRAPLEQENETLRRIIAELKAELQDFEADDMCESRCEELEQELATLRNACAAALRVLRDDEFVDEASVKAELEDICARQTK